jgi:hypothetical protein
VLLKPHRATSSFSEPEKPDAGVLFFVQILGDQHNQLHSDQAALTPGFVDIVTSTATIDVSH